LNFALFASQCPLHASDYRPKRRFLTSGKY
jgi:hypothetical protein